MARPGGKDRGITQRKGREGWWVRIFHNGRERWHKCDTKSQAKALYGRLKADAREGRYFPKQERSITVKAWIGRCLEGSTNRDTEHEAQRSLYWADVFGSRSLNEITLEALRQHRAKMLSSGTWSPATINRYYSALRRVLTLAVNDGQLARHPMRGLKFLAETQKDRFFSDDELGKIQALMSEKEWQEIIIAVGTCMRLSEQFNARWDRVSFEDSYLTIPLPKGNRTRRVPLSEEVKDALRSLFSESPWVFPDPRSSMQPKKASLAGERSKRVLQKGGIKGASWHTLRHTGASRLLHNGVDIVTVSKILGHSTIQTTMRYLHLVKSQMHDAVNKVSLKGLDDKAKVSQATNRDLNRDQQQNTVKGTVS